MELRQFKLILIQVFLLPVLALLLLAIALYGDISDGSKTVSQIVQSDTRISAVTTVFRLIVDEETGLRGYQTTGDARFLQHYNQAESVMEARISALENRSEENEAKIDQVKQLRESYLSWHDGFAIPMIADIRAGGQANDLQLNLYGQMLMDTIRADLNEILQEARSRRSTLIELRQKKMRNLIREIFLMALIMGLIIGLFTWNRLHAVSSAYRNSLDMLKHRADELFESEQELRTTLSSIGDGVITCDGAGRVEMMNPVAQGLTGWSLEQAKGMPLDEVFSIVNEETRARVESPVAKVKRLGGVVGLANHTVLIRKDGSELHIADSGAPIPGKDGNPTGTVLVFRDVTLEKRTQDALVASEKLAVAGRLAATIAHEIHNPLDSVLNLLYLMRTGVSETESKQFMAMAEQELTRVTQISRAMLGLYRESKTPVAVDLREMLQEILLLMERKLNDLGVTIHTDLPGSIVIDGFPAELRQVFSNLITNAAEAAGRGGGVWVSIAEEAARVGSGGVRSESGATVRVRDNGPGIAEEIQPLIFQPFFTTKGQHGTGLGLWVSRGIITKHGGTITVASDASAESHGTTVSVFLATKPTLQWVGD